MHTRWHDLVVVCFNLLTLALCQVNGVQNCAQGFKSWEMVDARNFTGRNRQYLFPSLNFSCGGVISRWVLTRGRGLNVSAVNTIVLQVWRPEAESESTYTLQSEQTHTAGTPNAASYVFTASPSMTVSSGDVFGCRVPRHTGLRMAAVTMPVHTAFFSHNATSAEFTARNAELNLSPLISIDFTPFSTMTSSTEEIPDATASRPEPAPSLTSVPVSSRDSASVSPTKAGGGNTGDVSSTDESTVAVIVGVVLAVCFAAVLLALVVAAIICCRIKVLKKYSIAIHSRNNGGTAASHDYATMQPTYDNHTADSGTCTTPNAPHCATNLTAVSGEYTEVLALEAIAVTANSLEVSQVYDVPQSTTLEDHYDSVTSRSLSNSYMYVPTKEAREQSCTVLHNAIPIAEMENVYEETSFTTPEYENVQFAPPANEVEELYGQLAERKCIEIPRQSIKCEQLLGSGQFGEVFKGEWATPWGTQEVAIKTLTGEISKEDEVKFLQEAAVMAQFRHPHIVRLLGAVTVDEPNMIVLELLSKGDLLDYLEKQSSNKQSAELPTQLLRFCKEIADGMKYLSKKGFIHRDLAARNILLDGRLRCKIADFGLSRDIVDDTYYTATTGKIPIKWTAPEALFFKKYSTGSDVWSYGMLMKEIWSLGEKPFPSLTGLECVVKLQDDPHYVQPPPPGCPRAIYQQMVLCWNSDHHGRPTFATLLETLSGPSDELLRIPEESLREVKNPEMAAQIGASGFFSLDLYLDLQRYYY